MNLKLIVAISVIAAMPVGAQAQKPRAAKVTKTDAENVVKIISGDKAKTGPIVISWSSLISSRRLARRTTPKKPMNCLNKWMNWWQNWAPNILR
jgi:hypothetical protein